MIITVSPYKDECLRTLMRMKSPELESMAYAAEHGRGMETGQCFTGRERKKLAAEYRRILKFSHTIRKEVQQALERRIGKTYDELVAEKYATG
jgi:hypothetical protein